MSKGHRRRDARNSKFARPTLPGDPPPKVFRRWAGPSVVREPGITNDQAQRLAYLCRQLGWAYPGSGMTRAEADTAIANAQAVLGSRPKAPAPRPKPPGIANEQAKRLGFLCRQLGWPYRGSGMTRDEADTAIAEAEAALRPH
jgi:hypothetical protein